MRQFFSRVFRSAVGWSFLATALRFGWALFILPLVLRRVPPEELGLWYVFLSLGALASLIDFGFAQTINRAAGYLWAGAAELSPYGLASAQNLAQSSAEPSQPNLPLFSRLIAALKFYYLVLGAAALVLLLGAGGWWIYLKTQGFTNATSMRIAFLVYSLGVVLNLVGGLWIFVLNGVNRVRESFQISAFCFLENYTLQFVGLLAGLRVWALVIGLFAMGVTERLIGKIVFNKFVPLTAARLDFEMIRVLWPNAWRTGAVLIGSFLVLQANTLICSGVLGLKATASYGLSVQAVTLLAAVSSVWVGVKFPLINQLRAQNRHDEIANIFQKRTLVFLLTYLAGAAALLFLGPRVLILLHAKTQLLPGAMLATLLLIYLLEAHHSLYAGLVYSENVNAFVLPWLLSGVAIVLLSILLTPRFGVWGMLIAQGIVQICFNNWWTVYRGIRGLGISVQTYLQQYFQIVIGSFRFRSSE